MTDPNPAGPPAQSRGLFRSPRPRPGPAPGPRPGRRATSPAPSTRWPARPRDRIFTPWSPRPCSSPRSSPTTTPAGAPWPGCWPGAPHAACPPARPTPAATARPASGCPRPCCPGSSARPPTGSGSTRPTAWLFHGRRVVIVDGTTVTMPDTPENQAAYPQHLRQKPGCGSPIAQMVVLLCLATGCVLDAAIGRRIGQADRRARPAALAARPAGAAATSSWPTPTTARSTRS